MGLGTKVEYIEVNSNELDNFVHENYKWAKNYEFVPMEECGNDSSHSFTVKGQLDDSDLEEWEEFKRKNGYLAYQNSLVLNKLCADGFIEPGEYLVNVCW